MPAIVATVGSASANSFATIAEADTYFDGVLNAGAWIDEGDDDQKARALMEATRQLSVIPWVGARVDDTQALPWPRVNVEDGDGQFALIDWPAYLDQDVIPPFIKEATYRIAIELLRSGTVDPFAIHDDTGIKRKKTGPIETEYFGESSLPGGIAQYPYIVALVAPYIDGAGTLRIVRT